MGIGLVLHVPLLDLGNSPFLSNALIKCVSFLLLCAKFIAKQSMSISLNDKHKDFFDSVFQVVKLIPAGRVTSYGAIATYLSAAKASRMVGWAMNASHSFPEIPAHRVVNRNGLLTGKMHFETPTAMEERLAMEGVEVKDNQVVDFKRLFWNPSIELAM